MFTQIACFFSLGQMNLSLFVCLLPLFFSFSFDCITSLYGVLWAGEFREEHIPLVPLWPLDEMGFFSIPSLSQGRGKEETHETER